MGSVEYFVPFFKDKDFEQEEQERCRQEILEAGFVVGNVPGFERNFIQIGEFVENRFHARSDIVVLHVKAFSGFGNLLQHFPVHFCDHHIAISVFFVGDHLAVPDFRDRGSLRGTHADRIDHDALFGCILGRANGIVFMIFPVADDNDGLVVGRGEFGIEIPDAEVDGRSDSRALAAQVGSLYVVDKQFGSPVIGRQRKLEVGIAGKDDQSDAVRFHLVQNADYRLLGTHQAGWLDIIAIHAVGYIQGYHDIHSFAFGLFDGRSHLRIG